jgi:hypothetical protein
MLDVVRLGRKEVQQAHRPNYLTLGARRRILAVRATIGRYRRRNTMNANKMRTAGRRCRDCTHPVKNHRYSALVRGVYAAKPGTTCGCGCKEAKR